MQIKFIKSFYASIFVPIAFIYTYNFTTLDADPIITKEIGGIGKYHIKLEFELRKQFEAIPFEQCEITITRFVVEDIILFSVSFLFDY